MIMLTDALATALAVSARTRRLQSGCHGVSIQVLHVVAPPYLISCFVSLTYLAVSDFTRRQHTYCTFYHSVYLPSVIVHFRSLHPSSTTLLCTIGRSVFSFSVFRQRLKLFLFHESFSGILITMTVLSLEIVIAIVNHVNKF